MKTNRTGIWIPREIECLEDLSVSEKYLLSEIRSLTLAKGCFASNTYFAKLLGKKPDTISRMISKLKKRNYISQLSFDGRRRELSYCLGFPPKAEAETNITAPAQKSNAVSEISQVPFVPITTKVHNISTKSPMEVWKEFLNWTTRLAPSTRIRIQMASGPESLTKQDRVIWENFTVRLRPMFGS
ncbi:helix-turn-helix domain-containing protein [Leptospira meyeri]|uniref:helix-turn-helix domain-containing protein n=1 Tax=Leptospira meyeri TaxID=29508 RepID=UPI000C2A4B27|nr:helix-turn-helix domain-containing protein [Leptospira meyeri]PJZ79249.1 DNA-binding protein [Leptospira meyeri]PJZ95083.1 DNA-binding protein [Leptospira meyeri]